MTDTTKASTRARGAATIVGSNGARHSAILGIGGFRGSRVVTNAEICDRIDSSDEWIRTRSGIIERRWAEPHETVQYMSVQAAKKAIERAGIAPDQLDCVIVATVSHLLQTPAVAPLISEELGATPATAFDISAACAGFCHALALGSDLVRGGSAGHVLIIGVERLSDLTNHDDRTSAFLFADGAGAAVIGPSESAGIGPVAWGADGTTFDLIRQVEYWDRTIRQPEPVFPVLRMDGNPVFRWASFEMAKTAQQAIDRAGISVDDLDVFLPHQANMRIIDAMARTLHLPEHVAIARDIAHQGNTSAASIGLAAEAMLESGEARSGDVALMIAFGAGLAYAAQVVRLP